MPTPENEGIHFVSNLLIHMRYFNEYGVNLVFWGVNESELDVQGLALLMLSWDKNWDSQ